MLLSQASRHTERMRAPKRRRPRRRTLTSPPPGIDLAELAGRVSYIGSGEHKSFPSFAGPPRLRADASKCDPNLANTEELTRWLRAAIAAGHVGEPWLGDFPRYAWRKIDGVQYEAMLVNREQGWYKGYPLSPDEWPEGLK
jgi:hypothetical protein